MLGTTRLFPFYYCTDRASPRPKAAKEARQGSTRHGGSVSPPMNPESLTYGAYLVVVHRRLFHVLNTSVSGEI